MKYLDFLTMATGITSRKDLENLGSRITVYLSKANLSTNDLTPDLVRKINKMNAKELNDMKTVPRK